MQPPTPTPPSPPSHLDVVALARALADAAVQEHVDAAPVEPLGVELRDRLADGEHAAAQKITC